MTTSAPELWWLSFVDPTKSAPRDQQVPGGPGFLGVAVVHAYGFLHAVSETWRLGINPGGEVAGIPTDPNTNPKWIGRFLNRADIAQLEAEEEQAA
ncbi:hypothetical protein ACFYY5_29425 [Nocardia elegans]|uniref:Uncharacterized protein n=1 Tax=Nocardia elegans TaxID=300029 RepID=A0ABW6TP50_9NOCA